MGGDLNKSIMIGDSEVDSISAQRASIPFVLLEDGYTNKKVNEIYYDHLIKDYINFEKIVQNYL
jgi:phosphoglycolate phosphatase